MRGFAGRKAFARQVLGASRLQRCVRAWLRNRDLFKSVTGVFEAARRGDVHATTCYISDSPQLLYVRDRYGISCVEEGVSAGRYGDDGGRGAPVYSTLLHAACQVSENGHHGHRYDKFNRCGALR